MDEELTYYEQLLEKYKARLEYLDKKEKDQEHRHQLRMRSQGLEVVPREAIKCKKIKN